MGEYIRQSVEIGNLFYRCLIVIVCVRQPRHKITVLLVKTQMLQ